MKATNIILNLFIICMMMVLLLNIGVLNKGKFRGKEEKYIIYLAVLLAMVSLMYIIYLLIDGRVEYEICNQVINGFLFAMGFLISFVYGKYVACIFDYKEIKSRQFSRVMLVLSAVGILLDIISIKNKMYFSVVNGYYKRESLFFFNQLLAFGIMIYIGVVIIKNKKALGNAQFFSMISYLVLPLCSVIIQIFIFNIMLLYPAMALSILMVVGISYEEQRREMEEKLLQSKFDIMMTQIRPHFMYNSLTAIYGLCEKEPKKAKRAIADFSKYLRNNIDSISRRGMISFGEELKHIESYLNLEKLRYDDRLRVVYHIETEEFNVPALCIQPLVENGIKHGISQKEDGGVLHLSTKETDQSYVVIVEDTGVGFDYNTVKNDGKVHIGIENVRMRVERMCGGTLDITSECSKGTTVTVTIPKRRNCKIQYK